VNDAGSLHEVHGTNGGGRQLIGKMALASALPGLMASAFITRLSSCRDLSSTTVL